jgi:S-adenosylmethionine decarboxylase
VILKLLFLLKLRILEVINLFEIDTLHLVLDGHGCDIKKIGDLKIVYNFLDDVPNRIGMTKMIQPYVVRWKDKGSVHEGLTGFVTIAESHLAVHTFPDNGRVYVDIFSCKQFDKEMVIKIFKETFKPKRLNHKVVRLHEGVIP